jgi:hypothetical protein
MHQYSLAVKAPPPIRAHGPYRGNYTAIVSLRKSRERHTRLTVIAASLALAVDFRFRGCAATIGLSHASA